jgi:zinc/manganese transport system substrate-binding protein
VRIFRELICLIIFCSFFFLFACQPSENKPGDHKALQKARSSESPSDNKKLKVLTTIAPLYSFTKSITGDAANVENLLPLGTDPHDFSLSPEDIIKISRAQVVIKNDAGLEKWLDKLILDQSSSPGEEPIIVDSSSGVHIIDSNPHIWLSPRNAMMQVTNISVALIKADPANSALYKKNTVDYLKRLRDLDRDISAAVGRLQKKEFVSVHPAFLYFARDYGLKQAAVIREFPEQEPTPAHIADVINIIKADKINFIFTEPRVSHKAVDTIAGDLKLKVYTLDTLETGELYPEWYEEKMRMNLEILKAALSS